ncbi:hypothetical protein [Bacillus sp. REN16]|uniref:hypothetical protein n=1 Tax=Bacillus sp. REN16 TaxID=2887296 RepID=UPI001E571235|nr:hypothetical protein [Bacillus sp. REN16]MCC3359682.1 hypothetical protein [Bacillus sp. REN16]
MKKIIFLGVIGFLSLFINLSNVFAEENGDFVPEPKPDGAYYDDQFESRIDLNKKIGYIQVDPSSNESVKELLKTGEVNKVDLLEERIIVFVPPNSNGQKVNQSSNCDKGDLNKNSLIIQASCPGSASGVILKGPALYYASGTNEIAIGLGLNGERILRI